MSTDTTQDPARQSAPPSARSGTAPVVGGSADVPAVSALLGRPGVPFGRTLSAELRKMVDTRAGLWLVIVMAASAVLTLVAFLIWGPEGDVGYRSLLELAVLPLAMLLPVLGIMAATAEWTQRTGLVTFTLEPRRGRVVAAKALAALLLALGVMAAALAAAAVANVLGANEWDLTAAVGGGQLLALLLYVLQGVAFGLLFLNTPIAIVAVLVLPSVWSIATTIVSSLEDVGAWLDMDRVTRPLFAGEMAGQDWAQLATASAVWVLLPLAVGTYRVVNREVK